MAKDLTAVRIDGKLIEGLQAISARPGTFYSERTVSWLISQAVKEFITAKTFDAEFGFDKLPKK
jgi:hypothetical protein